MTDLEIRPLTPDDDMDAQLDLSERAFGPFPEAARAGWQELARTRAGQGLYLGAFLGGEPVASALIHDQRQYWLGRPVPCAGIAAVKVAPERRGRGIGRALMTELLRLTADRGYLVSALYPATVPIYRSLGWELAGAKYEFSVPARSLQGLPAPDQDPVSGLPPVRRAGPADTALVTDVTGRSHRLNRDSGPVTWDEARQRYWLGQPGRYSYLAGEPGREDGFGAFRWADGGAELYVDKVHAVTPGALRELWAVIASHASVARTIRGLAGPSDPFWWLTRERDATVSRRSMWMLRVVDAAGAIAGRGFPPAVSVSVPLVVRDEARPANAGRWRLQVALGAGTLLPNEGDSSPDPLTLGARGLAALYAGIPVSSLRLSGLAAGCTPEADAALDAAFAATPYLTDSF